MRLVSCVVYFLITGAIGFVLGRLLPKHLFRADAYPYRSVAFERESRVYERIGIHRWQKKLIDMSRIFPFFMPPKNLKGDFRKRLPRMIQETCVAECIHICLCISGLYCLRLWRGWGGVIVWLLYVLLFNLPYILIQRYNRPRLSRLQLRLQKREGREEASDHAHLDPELQYR